MKPLWERKADMMDRIEESKRRRAELLTQKTVDVNGGKVHLREYTAGKKPHVDLS